MDCRLYGSYAETAFEEVIEANRRRTWTHFPEIYGKATIRRSGIELVNTGASVNREANKIKIVFICLSGVRKSLRPQRLNGIDSRCAPSGQETRCNRRKGHHRKCRGESQRVPRAYLIEEVAEQAR